MFGNMESNKKYFMLEKLYFQTTKFAEEVISDTNYNPPSEKISGVIHQNKRCILFYDLKSSFTENINFEQVLCQEWKWYVYEGVLITDKAVYDCLKYKSVINKLCSQENIILN